MIRARTSAGTKAIAAISVRTGAGLLEVAVARLRNATAMKQFFAGASPVTVTASPTSVSGATAGFSSVTTNSVTATPTGGAAPYAYVWTLVTDDGGSWGTINPTSQTTAFTCGDVNDEDQFNATFRCTVTDALGSAGAVDVPANVINYGGIYP